MIILKHLKFEAKISPYRIAFISVETTYVTWTKGQVAAAIKLPRSSLATASQAPAKFSAWNDASTLIFTQPVSGFLHIWSNFQTGWFKVFARKKFVTPYKLVDHSVAILSFVWILFLYVILVCHVWTPFPTGTADQVKFLSSRGCYLHWVVPGL